MQYYIILQPKALPDYKKVEGKLCEAFSSYVLRVINAFFFGLLIKFNLFTVPPPQDDFRCLDFFFLFFLEYAY